MSESTTAHLNIKCPNCGSPEVGYSAEKFALHCEYCGYTRDLPREKDNVVERPLRDSYSLRDVPKGLEISLTEIHCNSCGSDLAIPKGQVNITCPFCGSTSVNESAQSERVIQPSGILPFTVPQEEAVEKFKNWIGAGWFRPGNLSRLARIQRVVGVYLPFWTYDAYTESQWTADAGYYYYETQKVRGPDGRIQTRTIQKVRWRPARGYYEHFFDDVLICSSHGIQQSLAERIYPFHLDHIVNYDSQYLLGWETELYQKNIREGFDIADQIMDRHIRSACASQIPGDTYRNLRVHTEKDGITFKHILLPIWIAGYTYKSKVYQFVVNGQTGKIAGYKPWSWPKIIAAICLGLILIATIVYLTEVYQNPEYQY